MKHKIAAIFTSLALVSLFALAGQSQVHAAGSTSFSALAKITNQALNDAHASDVGEVCVTVDALGTHTSTQSRSGPPMNYSGNQGDRWIYKEMFELEMFNYRYLYWDGSIWLDSFYFNENSDESEANSEDSWNRYDSEYSVMFQEAQKSRDGYTCKFSELSRIQIVGQNPSPTYKGQIGDVHIKVDSKYNDAKLRYIWNGSKWIADLWNTYRLARAAAIRTKAGEYCIYGANKDISTSFYETPPKSYKGVKGDLWIVLDATSGNKIYEFFWSGKVWVPNSPEGTLPRSLMKINDAAQFKARNSATGEVCYVGTLKGTQTFSAKLPKSYKGKVNDSWTVMDKKGESNSVVYFWTGKSWVLN